ncbi:hypothetical protein [Planctobacterium marinum]|uniref:SGNH/GDSL hydrolase family protein n=1 Tax=Planctobacterium marinum TaxID=1631968 RepID=A0AA48KSK9_9ALTE|nr:hypothetical protein MACH26_27680 [Planctobacterium marinum]
MNKHLALIALTTSLLSACGGSGSDSSSNPPAPTTPPPDNYDLTVLMIGNSHTNFGNLPGQLQETLQAYYPDQNILVERAVKSLFLSDHLQDSATLNHLEERNWDYVILQAQKYSVTRTVEYPTSAAQSFINKTKEQGGVPVLFPEWGQRHLADEAAYIYDIHQSIAEATPSCIAPIGFAWDNSLLIQPSIELHASDGNHSNPTGAYLTAQVLFETITAHPAELLGELSYSELDSDTQLFLQQMASQAVAEYPPCEALDVNNG